MTAQHPSRTGPPGYQTPRAQVGERDHFTPRWPTVVGASVTLALGVFAILTGSRTGLSMSIAVNVLLVEADLYGKPRTVHRAPTCRFLTTGPAW
jgi:hypothetical protein